MLNRAITVSIGLVLAACSSPEPVRYGQTSSRPVGPAMGAAQGPFQPNANLYVCNNISISNRPPTNGAGKIQAYAPMVVVNGVVLATAPSNEVCMTSGFGPRYGRMHKGIDLQSRPAGTIYSAAPGIVREAGSSRGFGNQVVIDHGRGVFTRYAHLAHFTPGLRVGQKIGFGQPIGKMGATGNATAVHLHYEILQGNYHNPKRSFGLKASNPLTFPAWQGLSKVS